MDNFRKYIHTLFKDPDDFLRDWDFEKIERDYFQWRIPIRWLSVYVLVNECDQRGTHTRIGCVDIRNLKKRIDQHNGLIPGGPSETKRGEGRWKPMFYLIIPPYRNYSSKEIKNQGRNGRGWQSRCEKTLEIAIERGLEFKISSEVFDSNSKYYAKNIAEIIEKYIESHSVKLESLLLSEYLNQTIKPMKNTKKSKSRKL